MSLSGKMNELGCKKNPHDPAMFFYFSANTEKDAYAKKPIGVAVSHVDDLLHAGKREFNTNVMNPLKAHFKFGSEEKESFRYVGLNVNQEHGFIEVDQDHYVEALEVPDLKHIKTKQGSDILDEEGQTEFRSLVAKILQVGYNSRPDVCFEAKAPSTFYGKATVKDIKHAVKKMVKAKSDTTIMRIPEMGDAKDWVIASHGDAGIKLKKIESVSRRIYHFKGRLVCLFVSVVSWCRPHY